MRSPSPLMLAALLAGCAGFEAAPTSSECAASQSQLAAAQIALGASQATLTALRTAGVGGGVVAGLEAAAPLYQQQITALQTAIGRNCAASSPTIGVSTPIVSASVKLGA